MRTGYLGRHLVNGPASADWEIVAPSSTSLDLRNRDAVLDMVHDWKPTAIAHLAYRKSDRRSIVDASRHVAEAAAACGARLVHMSSDVVFPGRSTPYVESDEPFPLTDYARDKLDAERAVIEVCPGAVMIRTSLIYGTVDAGADCSRTSPTRSTVGPTMTFFTDEVRCPVHVEDVAEAVTRLAAMRGHLGSAARRRTRCAEPGRVRDAYRTFAGPRPIAGPHRHAGRVRPRAPGTCGARLQPCRRARHPLPRRCH